MKKIVFAAVVLLTTGAGFGQQMGWTPIFETEDGGISYLKFDSIQKNGSRSVYQILVDLRAPRQNNYRSYWAIEEADCYERKVRRVMLYAFEQNMAVGEPAVRITTPSEWRTVDPNTVSIIKLNNVCK